MQDCHDAVGTVKVKSVKITRDKHYSQKYQKMVPNTRGGVYEVIVEPDIMPGRKFYGKALCSIQDPFNRARGRAIAIGRAVKAAYLSLDPAAVDNNVPKLNVPANLHEITIPYRTFYGEIGLMGVGAEV